MNYYYKNSIKNFILEDVDKIQGIINNKNSLYDAGISTQKSWNTTIKILKEQLQNLEGNIIFEYTIPRIGKRIDVVLIINGIIFLLEFKINGYQHKKSTDNQVMDYALDLKNFHKESRKPYIIPMSISTEAPNYRNEIFEYQDKILKVLRVNRNTIRYEIDNILKNFKGGEINMEEWIESIYSPTPTIIESARYMYANHNVENISRSDAAAKNLTETVGYIEKIIDDSKKKSKKSVCFITGVPGAGKTLAGLNIVVKNKNKDVNHKSILLSGNGPLVKVLQEALSRDEKIRLGSTMMDARRNTTTLINNIHKFRDYHINNKKIPDENVVVFDEAQRAWNKEQLNKFMREKKGVIEFDMTEPECLLEMMDRRKDWCVVVCLVGGGQEINTGEAGIYAWIEAVKNKFSSWNVYISDRMRDKEYIEKNKLDSLVSTLNYTYEPNLHLNVSLRSFRSERLSAFIQEVLDGNVERAKELYNKIGEYPIKITRDIQKAKRWINDQKRGSERIGLLASSNGLRLRPHNIWVKSNAKVEHWFLANENHPESSNTLEQVCTEFDVQGLEIDYSLVAWDGDFRREDNNWKYYNFRGDRWNNINIDENKKYKMNAYRVLLTRARQGMIIFVPKGVDEQVDKTRGHVVYDETYNYLLSCGIESID